VQGEDDKARLARYKKVLDNLALMAVFGAVDFSSSWPWQSAHYDESLILEKESRYFVEAFVNGFLGRRDVTFADLESEFAALAHEILGCVAEIYLRKGFTPRNIAFLEHFCAKGPGFFGQLLGCNILCIGLGKQGQNHLSDFCYVIIDPRIHFGK